MKMSNELRINFVGDIMLGELIENFKRGVKTKIEKKGIDPFEHCREEFNKAHLNVGNLECLLTDVTDKEYPISEILRAPKSFVKFLNINDIKALGIADFLNEPSTKASESC